MAELRHLDNLKEGLSCTTTFSPISLANGLISPSGVGITHQDLQTWAGMDGWDIDFEEVIKLIKCEVKDKKINGDHTYVSKEEFLEFLKPKKKWLNTDTHESENDSSEMGRVDNDQLIKLKIIEIFAHITKL